MKKVASRISLSVLVFGLATLLVLALAYAGNESTGPIEDFMSVVGTSVASIEHNLVTESRDYTRADSMKWFEVYRKHPSHLLKPDTILLGAYDNLSDQTFEGVISLEDQLNTKLPFIQLYTAWGSKTNERFPFLQAKAIYDLGSVPMITWEPWLDDFDTTQFTLESWQAGNPNFGGLKNIASGKYDLYIDKWAAEAKAFGAPVFVRFGHEMNDPYRYPWGPQNNKPEEFIAGWQHLVDRFRADGAKNVIWVWSPHPAYKEFSTFYPGEKYVDWVGVPALNYGSVAAWSKWWSFDEIFGAFYADLSAFKKPIMISELGCLNVGGNRADWYHDALSSLPKKYPMVKSVVFFHSSNDNTTTYKSLNWQFKDDQATVKAISAACQSWQRLP